MNTQTIATTTIREQVQSDLQELNIYDSGFLLESIENKLAILEGGANAIVVKSFRSARFSLLKQIAQDAPLRVLSYEPASQWADDLAVLNRKNITIIYANEFPEHYLPQLIKNEKINAVYIATINSETLAVENHNVIIAQAHTANVPVIFDNTKGALGAIYRPLTQEADFVLVKTTDSSLNKSGIGAFIAEGYSGVRSTKSIEVFNNTAVQALKKRRTPIRKQRFLISEDEQSFDNRLQNEIQNTRAHAKNTFTLAKWLNQAGAVVEVEYPGLKTSASFINAENILRGGYGTTLKFKLWDINFNHNFLRSTFLAGKPKGLIIKDDSKAREFSVTIKNNSFNEVITYFEKVFSQLNGEIEYRAQLKKQLKLEEAVRGLLQGKI
jgi:O-acetylhomoserine (thiol)-lyase